MAKSKPKPKLYELTDEHRAQLKPWADQWIANAMSTAPMAEQDRSACVAAVNLMYREAGLKAPRVVFVPSPFAGRFAAGFSAAIWYGRKDPKFAATDAATRAATDAATRAATGAATWAATWAATRAATKAATWDATEAAAWAATEAATDAATWAATEAATDAAIEAATDAATRAATRDATDVATWDATEAATRGATWDATWDATEAATDAATRAATWDATWDATDAATRAATDAATRAATWAATRDATRDATRGATEAATWDATRAATRGATEAATRAATRGATWAATWDATEAATRAATEAATRAATRGATWAATWAATEAATRDATGDATRAATEAATRGATDAATRAATEAATWAATWDATEAATRAATWDATEAATRAATWAATDAATWDATWGATWDATRAATWDATRAKNFDEKNYWLCPDLDPLARQIGVGRFGVMCANLAWRMHQGGNQWSGYDSFLSFFRHIADLPLNYIAYDAWETLARRSGTRWVHEEFCIISDRPELLTVDEQNRPHNEDGPFCRWRDGTAIYAIHGVYTPAWIVERPQDITPALIDAETNTEVRRVMIERYKRGEEINGAAAYVRDVGGDLLDDDPRWGRLYRRHRPDDDDLILVQVPNATPEPDGSIKEYWLRVHPECRPMSLGAGGVVLGDEQELTALNAIASTFGMTGKEYARVAMES